MPLPVSPWMSTGIGDAATFAASAASLRMTALSPKKGSTACRDLGGLARQRYLPHPPVFEGALDDHQERRQLDRLGEELLGSFLDGLHREIDGAVAGEEHDGQGGVLGLQGRQHLEAVAVGQGKIHDRGVHHLAAQGLPNRGEALDLDDPEALAAQEPAEGEAHVRFVVDDENPALSQGFPPCSWPRAGAA